MSKYSKDAKSIERRKSVIKRLENQLLTGYKSVKNGTEILSVKLTDIDIGRIKKEVEILKTRL